MNISKHKTQAQITYLTEHSCVAVLLPTHHCLAERDMTMTFEISANSSDARAHRLRESIARCFPFQLTSDLSKSLETSASEQRSLSGNAPTQRDANV